MKFSRFMVLVGVGVVLCGWAPGKPKKGTLPAVFQNARYVYVQAMDGDAMNPNLYNVDRQAIFDVQDRLRDWDRYRVTLRREDADLIFMVRKGRIAGVKPSVRGGTAPPLQTGNYPGQGPGQNPGQYPGQGPANGPMGGGPAVGVGADMGPGDDTLQVFATNQNGKLLGPVWSRELEGGLDAPSVQLVRQLEAEVEKTYPQPQGGPNKQPNGQPPAGNGQPAQPGQPQSQPSQPPQSQPPQPQP